MATQRRSSTGARKGQRASQSFLRRFFGFIFSRYILVPLFIIGLLGAGFLYIYYLRYTELIDAGLRGDAFVRSSGIYAAPLQLRTGSNLKSADFIAQLRRVGYLEKGSTKNEKRGQYLVRGNSVEIYPGNDAVIDGEKAFRNLRVSFGKYG